MRARIYMCEGVSDTVCVCVCDSALLLIRELGQSQLHHVDQRRVWVWFHIKANDVTNLQYHTEHRPSD